MALTKAEKEELEALRKRAAEADTLEEQNEALANEAGEAAAALAQAEIDKQDAIKEALAEKEAEFEGMLAAASGGIDKSIVCDPKKPPKFDQGQPYSQCFGGDIHFAQNGWYFGHDRIAIRPVNVAPEK